MSFVNLMGNDVWTSHTISERVVEIIRTTVSADDELKAARLSRQAVLTANETAFIDGVDAAVLAAVAQGREAAVDNELLKSVIAYEAAFDRLDCDLVTEPATIEVQTSSVMGEAGAVEVVVNPAIAQDAAERDAAEAVMGNATADVVQLFVLRNPPAPIPEPVVEPVFIAPIVDAVSEATL